MPGRDGIAGRVEQLQKQPRQTRGAELLRDDGASRRMGSGSRQRK